MPEAGVGDAAAPVVDIGGTHVTAALVDPVAGQVIAGSASRQGLDDHGTAEEIIGPIVRAAARVAERVAPGSAWGVAIPGPFDYERGVGRFHGVGKFDALYGVDLRRVLAERIVPRPGRIAFVNDADAFVLGEWTFGAAAGHRRVVGITLGSGVGSAFLEDGTLVELGATVPPEGRVDLLSIRGRPLEETVSRRAIIARYAAAVADTATERDVREIAELARRGDEPARRVLDTAFEALGAVLAPWLQRFGATILVVGGAISESWDVIQPSLRSGLGASRAIVVRAHLQEEAVLIGAALHARRSSTAR